MIDAKKAKLIYDKENESRGDEAVRVQDAGDFFVIIPKIKSCLGIVIVSKEGKISRVNHPSKELMTKIFNAKTIYEVGIRK